MNLTIRQLRAFVALAQERHFTRAAARCHQTQPAFSALIKSLEDVLGARLFDRSTRRVELTAEGQLLNASATRLLRDLESAVQDVRDHVAVKKGRVCIAALPSLAAGWLPQIYALFHGEHPDVELALHDALLEPCLALVRNGDADMAVAAMGADMSGLDAEPLCQDAFHLVCREDHALAGRRAVQLRDLRECTLIQLGQGSSVRQSLLRSDAFRSLESFWRLTISQPSQALSRRVWV